MTQTPALQYNDCRPLLGTPRYSEEQSSGEVHACMGCLAISCVAIRRLFRWILFAGAVTLCTQTQEITPKRSMDALRHSFVSPPADSRPMVRWWCFGTAVEKP